MIVFDLHSHPGFKTIFNNRYSPWENIPANDFLLSGIIRSQSSLQQIIKNEKCNLLCISLYAPETDFVGQWLVRFVAARLTDALEQPILNEMIAKRFSYQKEREKELSNLNLPPSKPKELQILKSFSEYDPEDFSKLYILFSIEGGHAFYDDQDNDDKNIIQILDDFSAFVNDKQRLVFYITPCHLTPNIFLTHAYGNKILAKGKFIPVRKGITASGKLFLNKIVDEGLLIDVKHMSVISRQEFYEKEKWNKRPLLCSHAGVTGISWKQKLDSNKGMYSIKEGPGFVKVRYVKPKGILKGTLFNPCSINLYDEDIKNILNTKGLIGISMDLRIIGGERDIWDELKLNEKEFVSTEEYNEWLKQALRVAPIKPSDYELPYDDYKWTETGIGDGIWDEEDRGDEFEDLNNLSEIDIKNLYSKRISDIKSSSFIFKERIQEHLRFFVNQVFHIVSVAKKLSVDPWEHICIGSDFDGFIRTIDCCKSAAELNKFAERLIDRLPDLAKEANIKLPRPADKLIEDIFFNNSYRLMQQHFLRKPVKKKKASVRGKRQKAKSKRRK